MGKVLKKSECTLEAFLFLPTVMINNFTTSLCIHLGLVHKQTVVVYMQIISAMNVQ